MKMSSLEVVEVDPVQVDHFLTMNIYEDQRFCKDARLVFINDLMESKDFHTNIVAIARCVGGFVYIAKDQSSHSHVLMNSQHTLTVMRNRKCTLTMPIMYVDVSSKEELAKCFASFDNSASSRSALEIAKPYTSIGIFAGKGAKFASTMSSSVELAGNDFKKNSNRPRSVKLDECFSTADADAVNKCYEIGWSQKHLRRMSVLAVMYKTLVESSAKAVEFWTAVAEGELLHANDPRFRLRDLLNSSRVGDTPGKGLLKVSMSELTAVCIRSWNAWIEGREMKRAPSTSTKGETELVFPEDD